MTLSVEFWITLIRLKGKQSPNAKKFIDDACTHATKNVYFYEGDTDCLDEEGVKYINLGEGIVGCLGGLTEKQKIEIIDESFGIDVLSK